MLELWPANIKYFKKNFVVHMVKNNENTSFWKNVLWTTVMYKLGFHALCELPAIFSDVYDPLEPMHVVLRLFSVYFNFPGPLAASILPTLILLLQKGNADSTDWLKGNE